MFQRNTPYGSVPRACLRLLTPFLYFCLVLSLTWYESSLFRPASITSMATAVAGQPGVYSEFTLSRDHRPYRLPSLLAPAPQLPPATRLRPENRGNDLPPIQVCWTIAGDTPIHVFLRIDPVSWESGTPSFLLPSAYGLVPFAIPPPSLLV